MKTTRNSLLVSGLSLVLSVVILMGATFAWFTDSVTNSGNTIQSGALEIQAFVQDVDPDADTTYTIVGVNGDKPFGFEGELTDIETLGTGIISETNWEPGQSNAKLLTVKNNGSVSAKVKVDFTITEGGLTEALWYDFILVDGDGNVRGEFKRREMNTIETYPEDVEIPVGADSSVSFILVYGMDEDAGNEFQGLTFEGYVNILATQGGDEADGFGSTTYDANAAYPDKVNPGDSITGGIADAIDTNGTFQLQDGTTDLNGNLNIPAVYNNKPVSLTLEGATDNPADTVLDLGSGSIVFGGTQSGDLSLFSADILADAADGSGSKTLVLKNMTIQSSGVAVKFTHSDSGVPSEGLTIQLVNCVVQGAGDSSFGVLMGTGTKNALLKLDGTKLTGLGTALAIADSGNENDYVSGSTGNKVQMSGVTFENCANQYQIFNPSVYYADLPAVLAAGAEAVNRFNNVFTIAGTKLVGAGEEKLINGATLQAAVDAAAEGDTIYVGAGTYDVTHKGDTTSYDHNLVVTTDGLTIEGVGEVKLEATYTSGMGDAQQTVKIKSADNVTLRNLNVKEVIDYPNKAVEVEESANVVIEDCTITAESSAVYIGGVASVNYTVCNNTINGGGICITNGAGGQSETQSGGTITGNTMSGGAIILNGLGSKDNSYAWMKYDLKNLPAITGNKFAEPESASSMVYYLRSLSYVESGTTSEPVSGMGPMVMVSGDYVEEFVENNTFTENDGYTYALYSTNSNFAYYGKAAE